VANMLLLSFSSFIAAGSIYQPDALHSG
jgi:hypothetical protein